MNIFDTLKERGFIKQTTGDETLKKILEKPITFYNGFDATADSFHIGNLLAIMGMAHLQKAGHKIIALLGGATTMIGDPTGKTEMRPMLSEEKINHNAEKFSEQLKRFLSFQDDKGLILNNYDWMKDINYLEFLRDIGPYFRVNEMIKAEGYSQRLEREVGLSFLEFNYQVMQGYDFLYLYEKYDCVLQTGGDDQWGNILAGVNLIGHKTHKDVSALTFPLLTTSTGIKMGKTEQGAVWLDAEKTLPYEFYQFWINVDDQDVERFLKLFTFIELDEIAKTISDIRTAKATLAYEVTKIVHGEDEAKKAESSSKAVFEDKDSDLAAIPTTKIAKEKFNEGIEISDLLIEAGLASGKSEIKRLIEQGGLYLNKERVTDFQMKVTEKNLIGNNLLVRLGKKRYHKISAQ